MIMLMKRVYQYVNEGYKVDCYQYANEEGL